MLRGVILEPLVVLACHFGVDNDLLLRELSPGHAPNESTRSPVPCVAQGQRTVLIAPLEAQCQRFFSCPPVEDLVVSLDPIPGADVDLTSRPFT